jgi:hypothetical protein
MRASHFIRRLNDEFDRRSRGSKFGIPMAYFKMLAAGAISITIPSGLLRVARHYAGDAPVLVGALPWVALAILLLTAIAAVYYAGLTAYASVREIMEMVVGVRRVLKENAERRRRQSQPRGAGVVTLIAALLLPSSIRDDAIATLRDTLAHEADDTSSRRAVWAVVCRLLWGLIRTGLIERKCRLAGMLAGIAFPFTVVPGIQSILGVHFGAWLGASIVLTSIILGGLIGGWAGGLSERRVP